MLNTVYLTLWSIHQSIDSILAIQGRDLEESTHESLISSWPPWTESRSLCLSVRVFSGAPFTRVSLLKYAWVSIRNRQQWRRESIVWSDGDAILGMRKNKSCYNWASEPVSLLWVHVNAVDLQDTRFLKVLRTRIAAALFGEGTDLDTDMKRLQAGEHSFQAFSSFTLSDRAAQWHFRLVLYISILITYSRLEMLHLVND